jgi:hypothetical protein
MRIPTTRLDFSDIGYDGYWVVLPRSVKEGFVYDLGQIAAPKAVGEDDGAKALAEAERGRDVNIKFLELVSDWNLDGDDGKVLPLPRSLKDRKAKAAVVAEVPVEIIRAIAERLTATTKVGERVEGF